MWINIKWYNSANSVLREDGTYGAITANIKGVQTQVNTLLDLKGTNTRIYEVHGAMTQKWAEQLLDMGKPASLPLSFDRETGQVNFTLSDLAKLDSDEYHETLHFILNNTVVLDNRIPPYGMKFSEAKKRNALPVPSCQFGCPASSGSYKYFDSLKMVPPKGAKTATITLYYQPTSWEYIQFLALANDGTSATLAKEGDNLLDAWLNTGMAEPYPMATTNWTCASKSGC